MLLEKLDFFLIFVHMNVQNFWNINVSTYSVHTLKYFFRMFRTVVFITDFFSFCLRKNIRNTIFSIVNPNWQLYFFLIDIWLFGITEFEPEREIILMY